MSIDTKSWKFIQFKSGVRTPDSDRAHYVQINGDRGITAQIEGPFVVLRRPGFRPNTIQGASQEPFEVLVPVSEVSWVERHCPPVESAQPPKK